MADPSVEKAFFVNNLDNIRKPVERISSDPSTSKNLDDLFLTQLAENVRRSDATKFVENRNGEVVYGLPCEFREINGEVDIFIPYVSNWDLQRRLPTYGEHPPFHESYMNGRESNKFREAFARLVGVEPKIEPLDSFLEKNAPIVVGDERDSKHTPYHRLYLAEDGLTIELQSKPTLSQAQKIDQIKERLQSKVPVKVEVRYGDKSEKLDLNVESSVEKELEGIHLGSIDLHITNRRYIAGLDDNGDLTVRFIGERQNDEKVDVIYGFGHTDEWSNGYVSFYFDTSSRRHDEAKAGFAIESALSHEDQANLLGDLKIGEDKVIGKSKLSSEIVNTQRPFKISVGDYDFKYGMRSMVDFNNGEVTVELLVDPVDEKDVLKKKLLEGVASKLAKSLMTGGEGELEYLQERGLVRTDAKLVKSQGKILAVQ